MAFSIAPGVWPTMLTPFTLDNRIDIPAVKALVNWYAEEGCAGIFAVCQSSEMFFLSLEEKALLAKTVVEAAGDRLQVIASGHTSDAFEDQVAELRAAAESGVGAVVLVSNRLAKEGEDEEVWKQNALRLFEALPGVSFGVYECPYPYKRLLSPELLRWCADSGRIVFLKDTCCDAGQIRAKLAAIKGTPLKLFNANGATLWQSLDDGAAGYCGVIGNFIPGLYARMLALRGTDRAAAKALADFLSFASVIEHQIYPVNAKYYQQLLGLPTGLKTRTRSEAELTEACKWEVEAFKAVCERV